MIERPKVRSSKVVYDGWLNLRVDELEVSGLRKPYFYEVVTLGGDGVAVLPFLDDENVLLCKQYRHPVGETILELIQGGIKKDEHFFDAIQRELREETGLVGEIEYKNTMYPMPGTLDMRMHIFTAINIEKISEPESNPLEEALLITMPFKDILQEVIEGKHKDSVLVWAIMHHALAR